MAQDEFGGRMASVNFTGTRGEMFALMLRSYLLMLPTLGVYRFWMTTWKRRFYWSHTEIDGDPLEYTGHAIQLLIGFLYALVVFLPLYGLFFYLSVQTSDIVGFFYLGIGVLFWFFVGFAIYRARDFRLSRTLWRGIRFDQKGSAWNYAIRRFLWSIVMILTAGLIYPLMAVDLWRYRYKNTWYGDRQFSFSGRARQLAGPYYLIYFLVAVLGVLVLSYAIGSHAYSINDEGIFVPDGEVITLSLLVFAVGWLGMYFYQGREISRMLSSVRCGEASLNVRVRGRSLFGQFLVLWLVIIGVGIVVAIAAGILVTLLFAEAGGRLLTGHGTEMADFLAMFKEGLWPIIGLILGYLALTGAYNLLSELIMRVGYWKLIARNAVIANVDSLRSVRAGAEDPSLAGEGLADALNVGAY